MPIVEGNGPGEYPTNINYIVNGDPADDITFNRPVSDLDARTESIKNCVENFEISDVGGLSEALNGDAPLHPNLRSLTTLDYAASPEKIFAIDANGTPVLITNTLQGENNTVSTLGSGVSLYKEKNAQDLVFKSLKAGTNITLNESGSEVEIVSSPGQTQTLTKIVKNTTNQTIPAFSVVCWLDDGTIQLADPNDMELSDFCGITLEDIDDLEYGSVAKVGNIAGALAGLNAKPGQFVYLGISPGQLSLDPPVGTGNYIIRLGQAEPSNGVASSSAVDLFLQVSYVSEGEVV